MMLSRLAGLRSGASSTSRWRSASLAAVACLAICTGAVEAQELPQVMPGQAVKIVLAVPSSDGVRPAALRIEPARGLAIEGPSTVLLAGVNRITITVNVPSTAPPGLFAAAAVTFIYVDGRRTAIDCYVRVLDPDLSEVPPLPIGADQVFIGTESLVRIPGAEVPVWIPSGAEGGIPAAERPHLAPVAASKTANAAVPAQGANTLTGVAYAGATEIGLRGGSDAEAGFGVDLRGRVGDSTRVDAVFIRGWNPGLSSVLRYGMHRSRGHLRIRSTAWSVEAGELRPPNPLAGLMAPADGASVQKTAGVFLGSLTVGRPKYFAGGWGGHLVQGSVGLGFNAGSVSLLASDLARPVRTSAIVANPAPIEDSELITEDLERVGVLLSRENRIRSSGIETRLKFGAHNITAHGGWLDLVNSKDERTSGPVAAGSYSFRSNWGSLNGQFRTGPPSLPGTALAGDRLALGGKVTLIGPFSLVGQTYWHESSLLGRSTSTRGMGGAAGIEYSRDQARFHLQGNYRESRYLATTITRSISTGLRWPMGVFGIYTAVEYGEAGDGRRQWRIASYRGSLYAEGEKASVMLSGNYRDYGRSSPRLSLDLSGSLEWRGATLEGGTGVTRAGIFGDVFNAWTTFELPVPGELAILLGVDYDRWAFNNSPYLIFILADDPTPPWRFTVNVRRKLSLPLPFVK